MDSNSSAYLVSHNGMGDNLFMIGALHFLLKFYKKVFFLCKQKYYPNVVLFFIGAPNIICVPFDENREFTEIQKIINENRENHDIFVSGCHKRYIQNKITNESFIHHVIPDKKYTIDFDTLTTNNYHFIEDFYKDIHMNLTIFYDYFTLPSTDESTALFHSVKHYDIIFIQLKSSDGRCLNISKLLDNYLYDENTILLCNDVNLYDECIRTEFKSAENIIIKRDISAKFVYNKLINYVDVIKNSKEIYLIDSCFIGMVLPFIKQNVLKADKIRIIRRDSV